MRAVHRAGSGKLCRCPIAKRGMRPALVVVDAPVFDDRTRLFERGEPVPVQAFLSKPTVEALDGGVLCRLAGIDEGKLDATIRCSAIKCAASEFRTIVDKAIRITARSCDAPQHVNDTCARNRQCHIDSATSIAGHSRVQPSLRLQLRNSTPLARPSSVKSSGQRWFARIAHHAPSRTSFGKRLRGRRRRHAWRSGLG